MLRAVLRTRTVLAVTARSTCLPCIGAQAATSTPCRNASTGSSNNSNAPRLRHDAYDVLIVGGM
jgi:hypothetical protein